MEANTKAIGNSRGDLIERMIYVTKSSNRFPERLVDPSSPRSASVGLRREGSADARLTTSMLSNISITIES